MKFKLLLTITFITSFTVQITQADYVESTPRRRVVRRYYRDRDGGRVGRGILGGAASGALMGGIFGGGRGAAIGAGVGAGLGGITAASQRRGGYVEEVEYVEPQYYDNQEYDYQDEQFDDYQE